MTLMGGDPVIMLDAPLHATERALKKAGMSIDDIDCMRSTRPLPRCRRHG
jgi:acetyl-CoA acetyltransferase